MNRLFRTLNIILAAAAGTMVLGSCNIEQEQAPSKDSVRVQFHASMTKTVFADPEGGLYPSEWTTNKQVKIFVADKDAVSVTPDEAGLSTTFTAELPQATSGALRVFSPAGTYNSNDASKNAGGFTQKSIGADYTYTYAVMPAEQTPLAGSPDESAHFVAATMEIPSEGVPSSVDLPFSLANAFGKLTIKNLAVEEVASVSITFPMAVAGNSCKYRFKTGELEGADVKTLVLNADNVVKNDDGNFVFWFGCAPATMSSGAFEVSVTDADGEVYTKGIALSPAKALTLTTGKVKPISVDFTGIGTGSDEDDAPSTWTLATSVSDLHVGDLVVIASNVKGVTATDIASSVLGKVTTSFTSDLSEIADLGDGTMIFTLGGQSGAWTLTNEEGKQLGCTSTKSLAWDKGTQSWDITIDTNGSATISASSYGRILYNNSSPRFTTYTSETSASMLLPQIYYKSAGNAEPGQAKVTTVGASSIGSDSAVLSASFEKAYTSPYETGFQWGTGAALGEEIIYQQTLSKVYGDFSVTLNGLAAGTTYSYRPYIVVYENGEYIYYYGSVGTFTTKTAGVRPTGTPGWFELPLQTDANHDGIDDNNPDMYYSWTMRADVPSVRNFSAGYSKSRIHPVWVAGPQHSSYKGSASRTDAYQNDPAMKCEQSSKFEGYTRGHMIASSDRTVSTATNRQVFYYSNIGAQMSTGFNTGGGAWNNLETFIDGQFCSDTLYQVVGCIFDDFTDRYGSKVESKTGVNGADHIFQVPTAWYAVLLRTKDGNSGKRVDQCTASELKCAAFILGHRSNASHKPSAQDMYTVEDLEALTGLTFFVNVPNAPKSTAKASDWGL